MNPNTKVFAGIKINGIVTDWGFIELKYIPVRLGKFILESELDSKMFSSLDLRLSKRPITWDSPSQLQGLNLGAALANGVPVEIVDEDSFIDDEQPPITYAELQTLSEDPIWCMYKSMGVAKNRDEVSGTEYDQIVSRWKAKYAHTKFARLI